MYVLMCALDCPFHNWCCPSVTNTSSLSTQQQLTAWAAALFESSDQSVCLRSAKLFKPVTGKRLSWRQASIGGLSVQVKWRAELRERELERMSGLEGEWRRREATRTAEVTKIKAHYANLDSQTRQVPTILACIHVTCHAVMTSPCNAIMQTNAMQCNNTLVILFVAI